MSARQFDSLRASSLYCAHCAKPMPVREKLLLILPEKELFDYLCSGCGETIGRREVTATEKLMERAAARRGQPAAHRAGPQVRIL